MSDVATAPDLGGLTPAENAFFESKGETPIAPPETKAEPQPEGQGEAKQESEQPGDKVEKVVPLAALHEERGKRKEIEKRLREIELDNARYAERQKLAEEKAAPRPQPVDREADPFAYLNQVGDKTETIEQKIARIEQQEQARAHQNQVLSLYSNSVKAFKATAPDFDEAYQAAVAGRQKIYELVGHPNPEAAAQADEFQLVTALLEQGKNPAEVIYEVAKTYGYQPKAKGDQKDDKTGAAAKLETIEKGQAANKSLQSTGGSGGPDEMTAERLLQMPMDEFEAWTNKNPAKAKRIMGG